MAQLAETFTGEGVEPRDDFTPVPPGKYIMEITESSEDATKSGSGRVISLTWKIVEGDLENRMIWDRINYMHNSEAAQRIGQQALAELLAAVGHRGPLEDTADLHGIAIEGTVGYLYRKNESGAKVPDLDDSGNHRTGIKRYRAIEAQAPAQARQPAPSQTRQAPPASGGREPPPFMRGRAGASR